MGQAEKNADIKKHGISFEEARTTFVDESANQFFDPDHSTDANRFIFPGVSHKLNTLVVCHCFSEGETTVRIVSARKADKDETNVYWNYRK